MKKRFLAAAIATGLVATTMTAQAEVKVKWFGFGQITLNSLSQDDPNDGFVFGADRVRFGFKVKDGNFFGKLQADLNRNHNSNPKNGTLPEIIKDIVVGWKFSNAAKVSLGQFKTPLGMDFNTSGKKLDITKRGMEKSLVLERTAGAMISGRKIGGGFGYDVFYGNPAGRSAADQGPIGADVGSETTTVVNLRYDMGKMMHMELAYGVATGATGIEDYEVVDFGFKFKSGPSTAKFEYIDGTSVRGVKGDDETVYFIHYGHMIGKTTEVMVRYYGATASSTGAADTDLNNTYIGVNFYTGSNKTNGRIQLNYVLAGGDDQNGTTNLSGTTYGGIAGGYTDDAILTQYQVSF
jgi:phosphate-selective porin O/P